MKFPLAIAALLIASPAFAGIPVPTPRPLYPIPVPTPRPAEMIDCTFTEPFFNVRWNESTGVVETVYAQDNTEDNQGNLVEHPALEAGFQKVRTGENTFEIRNSAGKVVLRLILDFSGTDGMSDRVYPYSGQVDGIQGGCHSNHYDSH